VEGRRDRPGAGVTTYDAVVVGAGHNGLVAANHLADAGWSVLVLEAQPEPGGAVRSDSEVHPGFVHDTFSSFHPMALVSPALRSLRLEEHGLVWRHAPAPLGHPLPDGRWAVIHPDRERTAAGLDADAPGDGEAWLHLCDQWDRIAEPMLESLLGPFPPVRAGLRTLARLPGAGGPAMVRDLLGSARGLAERRFRGELARLLLCGNAGHADIPLGAPGSGVMAVMLSMLAQTSGFPSPEGGAGRLTDALVHRLQSRGGELRCGTEVVGIDVERQGMRRRVRAVRTREERIACRTVVADVVAPQLFGRLVAPQDLPRRVALGMGGFRFDPGTVKVDFALSGPIPWASPPPAAPGTLHLADSVLEIQEAMARAESEAAYALAPERLFLLAGQMTTTDPTRSPAGTESVWAYTHVPQPDRRTTATDRWGRDRLEALADRVQERFERLAPGFGDRVLARRVLGPRELEARDANLVGGAVNGGTAQLGQQLVLRPVPGTGRPTTGIAGLYLGSASAHPGGAVHGAAGHNAARAALAHGRSSSVASQRVAS